MAKISAPIKKDANKRSSKNNEANPLRKLFLQGLKDIYWAESELIKALPKLAQQSTSDKLKAALQEHLEQTRQHITRLEEVFASINENAEAKKCDGMQGLLKEGDAIIKETVPGAVQDAGIIGACQKVEHYEISAYGTLAAYAKLLNEKQALNLLLKTLGEEKKSDQVLSAIADTHLNAKAMNAS